MTAFRDRITVLGLLYAVGIRPGTTVWAPGTAPLPPKAWSGRGIRPTKLRREPGNEPMTVKALAMALSLQTWSSVTWREGTNSELSGRFTALRVRPAHRDYLGTEMRWRIERDYQDLKQEFGLGHYEGRGWRGFHHHATLSTAAYGFLMAQRLKTNGSDIGGKKTSPNAKCLPFPKITSLGVAQRAQRHVADSITTLRFYLSAALTSALAIHPYCDFVNFNLHL